MITLFIMLVLYRLLKLRNQYKSESQVDDKSFSAKLMRFVRVRKDFDKL